MRLYTLGTGHRPDYDFARILYKFGIQVLFDIRANTTLPGKELPHLSRGGMEKLCSENRISYVFLGNELGGGCRALVGSADRSAVRDWLKSEPVQRGLKIVAGKVPTRVCCILCSCYSPEFCRRLLLARELVTLQPGIEVVHILEETRLWQAPEARNRGPRPPRRR